jgi:hypothetical protein
MSRRGALLKRLEQMESHQVGRDEVAMLTQGVDGQVWLTLRDGRQFRDEEAVAMLRQATFPDHGGVWHVMGIDHDLVMGLKPQPSDEELERMAAKVPGMVSVLDRLGLR